MSELIQGHAQLEAGVVADACADGSVEESTGVGDGALPSVPTAAVVEKRGTVLQLETRAAPALREVDEPAVHLRRGGCISQLLERDTEVRTGVERDLVILFLDRLIEHTGECRLRRGGFTEEHLDETDGRESAWLLVLQRTRDGDGFISVGDRLLGVPADREHVPRAVNVKLDGDRNSLPVETSETGIELTEMLGVLTACPRDPRAHVVDRSELDGIRRLHLVEDGFGLLGRPMLKDLVCGSDAQIVRLRSRRALGGDREVCRALGCDLGGVGRFEREHERFGSVSGGGEVPGTLAGSR